MPDYELTITRIDPNPHYKPEPRREAYEYHLHDDPRSEQERTHDVRRLMTATLDEGEYEAVKQALIQYWARSRPPVAGDE